MEHKTNINYNKELIKLQRELVKLQFWVKEKGLKVAIIFEGRDAAGKGGAIKRISDALNPRFCKIVALDKPNERERTQWYFQRYVTHLPAAGEIALFDRSWYNRAGVERVMGFCTEEEYQEFLHSCPEFENMLIRSGIILIKYWFSVSPEKQKARFEERTLLPRKRWKLSGMDLKGREKWHEYSKAKDTMFAHTDTKTSPWNVIDSDHKKSARLNCITHILSQIEYENVLPEPVNIPDIDETNHYARTPIDEQKFVSKVYTKGSFE
ncbi:polyphosphate kinase 2 [Bernardetia sp. OM2101]|uniref:polyphosphate kinase 2 n=1 Tax=Bernardetia sp. OM2101 TaxID=3344876 RepID=UPI0035CEC0C3